MADNKKYYYMRLKEDFFDSEEIKVMESMPDGYLYCNILLKLYLLSLKDNGRLIFKGVIPYSPEMIASITRHQVGTVKQALDVFRKMQLIEVLDTGTIYMLDIQNFIGKSSTEADRQRKYSNRIQDEKSLSLPENKELYKESCKESYNGLCKESCKVSCKISTPEIRDKRLENRDKSIEKEMYKEKDSDDKRQTTPISYDEIKNLYNSICLSLPKCTAMSDARKKAIRARFTSGYTQEDFKQLFVKAEASSFLKGQNNRNWTATIDWLLKDANMAKVLDGNYDNHNTSSSGPVRQRVGDLDFIN